MSDCQPFPAKAKALQASGFVRTIPSPGRVPARQTPPRQPNDTTATAVPATAALATLTTAVPAAVAGSRAGSDCDTAAPAAGSSPQAAVPVTKHGAGVYWLPHAAWIEALHATDEEIYLHRGTAAQERCQTCRHTHATRLCPLQALAYVQMNDVRLLKVHSVFGEAPAAAATTTVEGASVSHPSRPRAVAAFLALQVPVYKEEDSDEISYDTLQCAAVQLSVPIRRAPRVDGKDVTSTTNTLQHMRAPWILVAQDEALLAAPTPAAARAMLLRIRRQLSQLVAPATMLFDATRGCWPVNAEDDPVEGMQDHLPVPRVGGGRVASTTLLRVLEGIELVDDYPHDLLQRACRGAERGEHDHGDSHNGAESGSSGGGEDDSDVWTAPMVPDVVLHWWDREGEECRWADDYIRVTTMGYLRRRPLAPGTTLPPQDGDDERCCILSQVGGYGGAPRYIRLVDLCP